MTRPIEQAGEKAGASALSEQFGPPIPEGGLQSLISDARLYSNDGYFDAYFRRDGTVTYRLHPNPAQGPSPTQGSYSISGNKLCIDDVCFEIYRVGASLDEVRICEVGAQSLAQCSIKKISTGAE